MNFNIASEDLGKALTEFGQQSEREIVFSAEAARGRKARAVKGALTPADALGALLAGTGLTHRTMPNGAIVVEAQGGPSARPIQTAAVATSAPVRRSEEAPAEVEEIIVTGTSIRGIAPAGSSVISISTEEIQATGASTTNQLLSSLPQMTNYFNALPSVGANSGGGNAGLQINRPNLRNLPASSSGAQTLVLIDGHRIVGAGTTMIAVDPDVVPPSILQRVEAITDGGSAVYGSDAIGGVINFITTRKFDGVKIGGRIGAADHFTPYDADLTVGKGWSTGSIYASYSFAGQNALFGYDRDYLKSIDWNTGNGVSLNCTPGTVSVSTRTYALPGLVLGTANRCDNLRYTTFYPEQRRHSVNVGVSQDLSDTITFDLRGLYLNRFDVTNSGPFANATSTVTISPTNPYYRQLPGTDANATQTVSFDYAAVFPIDAARQETTLETWQLTPTLAMKMGSWEARGLFSYGESLSVFDNIVINSTTQAALARGTTLATALNPYDLAATQNRALFDTLRAHNIGRGKNKLVNARLVLDGPVLSLPGGDVRAAFGAEYMRNKFSNQATNSVTFVLAPKAGYAQDVKSVFGELQIPIFGRGNAMPGLHALNLSVSARYDDYNDFGDTFNPKIGLTYEPVDWVTLRGYWGESFNAPNPAEQLQSATSQILALPNGLAPAGTVVPAGSRTLLVRAGAAQNLQPQTSENWSIGGDIRPLFAPGLTLSASYYRIYFDNLLGVPDTSNNFTNFFALYPELYIINPTQDQIRNTAAQTSSGVAAVDAFLQPNGPRVISIIDVRTRNLGSARLAGLDFSARYTHPTSFGSLDVSVAGNYQLTRDVRGAKRAPYVDTIALGASRLKLSTTVGATVGSLRAQATWNHNAGYGVTRSATLPQDTISSFNVINLFFRYDMKAEGRRPPTSFFLNIDNLFDQNPPVYKANDGLSRGYANGLTLGRLVRFGVQASF